MTKKKNRIEINKQSIIIALLSSVTYAMAAVSGAICLLGFAGTGLIVAVTQYAVPAAFFLVTIFGILLITCATAVARALQWLSAVQFFGWSGLVVLGIGAIGIYGSYKVMSFIPSKEEVKEAVDKVVKDGAEKTVKAVEKVGHVPLDPVKTVTESAKAAVSGKAMSIAHVPAEATDERGILNPFGYLPDLSKCLPDLSKYLPNPTGLPQTT